MLFEAIGRSRHEKPKLMCVGEILEPDGSWINSMEVTDVKIFPVDEDKVRAYVTITLDHCFVISDLKIITGSKGYFISMPSKKLKDGTHKDIAHPINSETRKMLEDRVILEYEKTRQKMVPEALL
jgi:stage V sporulation protein G